MTRFSRLMTACAAVAVTVGLTACNRVPDTVKIGVAQPMSGPLAALGKDMLNGVQLAVEELNAQGYKIDGKRVTIEIIEVDDKSSADVGKQVAQQLVEANVVAVIGHLNSGVSIAAAPVYGAAKIPQLAISTKPEYTQQNVPTTFRLVASDALQSKALGSYAATSIGGTKFAVVDDNTPYGKGLADLAAAEIKKAGKPVAVRASLDDKTTDFAALVPQLKDAGVDVFVTTLADFQVIALIEQMVKAGLTDMRLIGGDTIKTDKLPAAKLGIRAVYSTSPILEPGEFRGGGAFVDKYRARFKSDPVYGAHYAYDGMFVLADTMRRHRTADPAKITEALKKIDPVSPITNTMRFRADGEQVHGVVGVYRLERGAWQLQLHGAMW